ncbi:MerR family transcriptional regulator [Actinomadura rugatobispora]|uniref:MerR family transcriptional regulator n=1 Tax=Actinomadura rugatobispora TaxID=1994 RepID=A0ABW1A648_9ACTN|nr:MerR family transcriptional regulator [Actinomadura rugatobispora]
MTSYSPAETAEKSGFSIDTLRYYEKIGLLSDIARNASGRRVFSDDDLAWLNMLRCLRETGMPIAEMLRYSELTRAGEETVQERIELLQTHDRRVEEQIERLRVQQGQIQRKLGFYREVAGGCAALLPQAGAAARNGQAEVSAARP